MAVVLLEPIKVTDVFYRDSTTGSIYDLRNGKGLTLAEYYDILAETKGTVAHGTGLLTSDLVTQYAALHPPVMTASEAETAVRERYQTYLKRSPHADEADDVIFWRDATLNLAAQHGKEFALAELNHAFTESQEYKDLQAQTSSGSGGSTTTGGSGTTTGSGSGTTTTTTTTAAGDGILDKLKALPTWAKIGGGIAALVGLAMLGGDGKR